MDEHYSQGCGGVEILSPEAGLDLSAIYTYTLQTHGFDQAERYGQFLKSATQELAQDPSKGNPVANRPSMFECLFKWKNARYGHRIFYRVTDYGILCAAYSPYFHESTRSPGRRMK